MRERIKQLRGSESARTLAGNFASLSLLQVASYLFPLITLPYLAKTIGVDKFGAIAFGSSVIVYFHTLVDYGFNYTAVRDISKSRGDPERISRIFSSVIIIRLLLTALSFILLVCMIKLIPVFYENRLILYLTFLYIPGYVIFPDWFFQAIERMKYITIMNVLSKLVFTVLVFVVIRDKEDYIYQPVLVALGFLVSGVWAMILIFTRFGIRFVVPGIRELLQTFKGGFNMFINLLLPNLYTNFSIILLRLYGGEVPTGIFSGGEKFIGLSSQVTSTFSRTFFPFLARRMDKHDLYRKITFGISLAMSLFLFFGAKLLVGLFYTDEFKDAVIVIRILSLTPLAFFMMDVFGTNYMVLKNREHILRNIVTITSLAGFGLTLILVNKYLYVGAALSIIITRILRGMITWYLANRQMKEDKDGGKIKS